MTAKAKLRGCVLTLEGLKRLEDAIAKKFPSNREKYQDVYKGVKGYKYNFAKLQKLLEIHCNPPLIISRDSIQRILCRSKGVDKSVIEKLFQALGETVGESDYEYAPNQTNVDNLLQVIRNKLKSLIQRQCGTMKVLDMSQPVELGKIYTQVNILKQITGRQRKEEEYFQSYNYSENFERVGLGEIKEKNRSGLDVVNENEKLLILGKPGAGKTTFLKYLAIYYINEINVKNRAELVPIFITLKDFAETKGKLEAFILKLVGNDQITKLLESGQVLVLLDGLDEVKEIDSLRVLGDIKSFTEQFWGNKFVLTCRIAAKEYSFDGFTEVEIADFDDQQVGVFANNWFRDKEVKAENFLQKVKEDAQVKELTTNPLLLTLLCLTFEEAGRFPKNRAGLYKEAIDALLRKWDAKRGIERDQVYKNLWLSRKEDLLSQLAWVTFEQEIYFFKEQVAEQHIAKYICNLPEASTDSEALQADSGIILKSIEAQHGLLVERAKKIYSFSHLTFHEYFAAREIIQRESSSNVALQKLVKHMKEERWREVFIIAVEMSSQADRLFQMMKEEVDALIANSTKLQSFLEWVQNKSSLVKTNYKSAAVRAYYLDLDLSLALTQKHNQIHLANAIDPAIAYDLNHDLDSARSLARDRILIRVLIRNFDRTRDLIRVFKDDFDRNKNPEFSFVIQTLRARCGSDSPELSHQWWRREGQDWIEDIQTAMREYRSIGYDWQFIEAEMKLLQQYYNINLLLVRCLNSDCYITKECKQKIEDALLLPMAEIKKLQ